MFLDWELWLRIDHESAVGGMGALNFEENAIASLHRLPLSLTEVRLVGIFLEFTHIPLVL